MKTIHVIIRPIPAKSTSDNDRGSILNKYTLPRLCISASTTAEEVSEYQQNILGILSTLASDVKFDPKEVKELNKIIEEIVSLLTKLLLSVQKKNLTQSISTAARLHNLIQTFNITGTFRHNIKSLSTMEDEIKLRELMINRILSHFP